MDWGPFFTLREVVNVGSPHTRVAFKSVFRGVDCRVRVSLYLWKGCIDSIFRSRSIADRAPSIATSVA